MPPNILFLLTDDQRCDTIGALGNPHIRTPHLDSLVRGGFAFQKNFCTTPICTPARAEILTGCDSFRNRVLWFGKDINAELATMPRTFHEAGYHTIHVGKWHNDGHPRDRGFSSTRHLFQQDNLNSVPRHGHWMRYADKGPEVEGHSTEIFTDGAIAEIRDAPADQPWFCLLGYHAPHDPHHSPAPFDEMYAADETPLFPNHMPEHPIDTGSLYIRDELLESWPRTQAAMRRYRARYYGMISHLDFHIGRLLAHPALASKLENTIVVFTGDQGLAAGSHGLLGKENMYDHSIASPLILRGPGVPAGGQSTAMAHQIDLFPTLCDLAGIAVPSTVQGRSLKPVLEGRADEVRDAVLCEFCIPRMSGSGSPELCHVQRAIRTDRWKLIWNADPGEYQLFDLQRDADELVNLLAAWRRRWQEEMAAGGQGRTISERNPWAAWDPRPDYEQSQIDAVAVSLWKRMLQLMDEQEDWLPASERPRSPIPEAQARE